MYTKSNVIEFELIGHSDCRAGNATFSTFSSAAEANLMMKDIFKTFIIKDLFLESIYKLYFENCD